MYVSIPFISRCGFINCFCLPQIFTYFSSYLSNYKSKLNDAMAFHSQYRKCHWQGHLGGLEGITATQSVEVLGETDQSCRQ